MADEKATVCTRYFCIRSAIQQGNNSIFGIYYNLSRIETQYRQKQFGQVMKQIVYRRWFVFEI